MADKKKSIMEQLQEQLASIKDEHVFNFAYGYNLNYYYYLLQLQLQLF